MRWLLLKDLRILRRSPLLVALRVSRDAAGGACLRAEHRFPAHLTEFVLEGPGPRSPQP